jgi:hypothetical protein
MLHLQRAACHLELDIPGRDPNSGMLRAIAHSRTHEVEARVD